MAKTLTLRPIGFIRIQYKDKSTAPRQPGMAAENTVGEIRGLRHTMRRHTGGFINGSGKGTERQSTYVSGLTRKMAGVMRSLSYACNSPGSVVFYGNA